MRQPSLDECRFYAAQIGLVPIEAEKFFHFFESNGWMVGKNPMKSWHSAMAGWKLRSQQQQESKKEPSRGMQLVLWRDELKMIDCAIETTRKHKPSKEFFDPKRNATVVRSEVKFNSELLHWQKRLAFLSSRREAILKNLGMSI